LNQHKSRSFSFLFLLTCLCWSVPAFAVKKNGFVLDDASVPTRQILFGGPKRDGIPAINKPVFVNPAQATYLKDDDRVLGVTVNKVAKAYPIRILDYHEIVNDKSGNQHFTVTYCPLCGTGMVFAANADKGHLNFGVSGLLYNSDVLLYDRNTGSLWSQIMGEAISGKLKGTKLTQLPVLHTSWSDWRNLHPHTLVLSDKTGFPVNYKKRLYAGYKTSRDLYFKVTNKAPVRYHPKEQVMGLEIAGKYKAYAFKELDKNALTSFTDDFAGKSFEVHWNAEARNAYITDTNDEVIVTTVGFWFAWFTFHPQTEVFQASD